MLHDEGSGRIFHLEKKLNEQQSQQGRYRSSETADTSPAFVVTLGRGVALASSELKVIDYLNYDHVVFSYAANSHS